MSLGEGIALSSLENSDKTISAIKAEEGNIWLTVTDEDSQKVVHINLTPEMSRKLGQFLVGAKKCG